jgi:hypothetical protein
MRNEREAHRALGRTVADLNRDALRSGRAMETLRHTPRKTWAAYESGGLIESTTRARQIGLFAVLVVLIIFALSGCATCREHPTACKIAVGVVATSLVLSGSAYAAEHIHTNSQSRNVYTGPPSTGPTNPCANNPSCTT